MTLKVNVRLYGPVFGTGLPVDNSVDGIGLVTDHILKGVGDADPGENPGEVIAYLDVSYPGPYEEHGQDSSAIDLKGTKEDYEALIASLREFVDLNWPEQGVPQP